jgi:hypothetical protein
MSSPVNRRCPAGATGRLSTTADHCGMTMVQKPIVSMIHSRISALALVVSPWRRCDKGIGIRNGGKSMSGSAEISVLGICGSLRRGSYNMAALRAAIELQPPGMTITIADIGAFPLYNEDVRAQGFPAPVETFRRQIKEADALLFATPEYN